jgi:hypothetical protein
MSRMTIATAVISLAAVHVTGAAAPTQVIHVQAGDRIAVNRNLGCLVTTASIVCGGAATSRISADVRSSGEIVVQVQPTPHGVYPFLSVRRAECSATSGCNLVLGRS